MKRFFRLTSLVVPTWIAWYVAYAARQSTELTDVVTHALGPLWVLVAGALLLRATAIAVTGPRHRLFARLDLLTGRGAALSWTAGIAITAAVFFGYPSLAVVGIFGAGLLHLLVLRACVALRGLDPMRASRITRRFVPETVYEGDALKEEIRLDEVRIPIGFRLFVQGHVGPRWAESRHVVSSGEDVLLESDVGPAIRGEHEPAPLEVWLEDVFGLCRSPVAHVHAGDVVTVRPAVPPLVQREPLLQEGVIEDARERARRLPAEGLFALREYQLGDDVRRIHWIRSLVSGELVVRLPDEIPPERPRVRLLLDTYFPGAETFACDAPAQMLDALVRVWLSVGQALTDAGARVTLVAANAEGKVLERELGRSDRSDAIRFGARMGWQPTMPAPAITTDEATFVVSRGVLSVPPESGRTRWIVVLPEIPPPPAPLFSNFRLAYPAGSSENRWSDVRRVHRARSLARVEHRRAVLAMRVNVATPPKGSFAAITKADGRLVLEAIR